MSVYGYSRGQKHWQTKLKGLLLNVLLWERSCISPSCKGEQRMDPFCNYSAGANSLGTCSWQLPGWNTALKNPHHMAYSVSKWSGESQIWRGVYTGWGNTPGSLPAPSRPVTWKITWERYTWPSREFKKAKWGIDWVGHWTVECRTQGFHEWLRGTRIGLSTAWLKFKGSFWVLPEWPGNCCPGRCSNLKSSGQPPFKEGPGAYLT